MQMKLRSKYNLLDTPHPQYSLSKNIFSVSNFFMHIFNMSATYLQSVEKIQWKLWEELISQSMHYQPLFTRCSYHKMAKLKAL